MPWCSTRETGLQAPVMGQNLARQHQFDGLVDSDDGSIISLELFKGGPWSPTSDWSPKKKREAQKVELKAHFMRKFRM